MRCIHKLPSEFVANDKLASDTNRVNLSFAKGTFVVAKTILAYANIYSQA